MNSIREQSQQRHSANLLIYLLSGLELYLTEVSSKQSEKSLRTTVDDIDLVERDCVNNLLPLLDLSLWTLHEASLGSHGVEVSKCS